MARTFNFSLNLSKYFGGFVANDTCAICLINFTNEVIAVPDCCNHGFCWSCLETWERNNKICPIDREFFIKKYYIINYSIYKYYTSRLLPMQTVGEIICNICSIGDNDPTRRCTACSSVVHEKCLDNLNCPAEWKTGSHINHEFCRAFTEVGSLPAPDSALDDEIIIDSDSNITDASLDSSDIFMDEVTHPDEDVLTEDESQDGSVIWISDEE